MSRLKITCFITHAGALQAHTECRAECFDQFRWHSYELIQSEVDSYEFMMVPISALPEKQPLRGYWGKPTAVLDFCEENYIVTFYTAEFCKLQVANKEI